MGKDLNRVQVIGHLGATPEMRYTAEGTPVTSFRVAVNGPRRRDGTEAPTEWFRITAWDKLGEICNQYLEKGTRVYVEGRLQTRTYTDRDGVERQSVEVVAQDMIILSSRSAPAPAAAELPPAEPEPFDNPAPVPPPAPARPPTGARPRTSAPNAPRPVSRNQPQPVESDDDIPF